LSEPKLEPASILQIRPDIVSFPASALPKSKPLAVVTHNERIRVKFRYGEVLRFEIEAKKWYVV
jgi:hypothetical protein